LYFNGTLHFSSFITLVKKFLITLILCFLSSTAFSVSSVTKPSGPVADYASIVDENDERQIYLIAQRLWEQAKIGIVVVTLQDIGDTPIEEVATELYKKWGIGSSRTDEGILLLVTLNPRKIRIETGYGSESYLNDAKVGRILDTYAVPYLSSGNYSEGIRGTVMAVAAVVGNKGSDVASEEEPRSQTATTRIPSFVKILLGILLGIFLLGTPMGRAILIAFILSGGRGGHHGGGFGGGFGGGGFGGGFGGGRSGGGGSSRSF
jgi:uncharacterized protein